VYHEESNLIQEIFSPVASPVEVGLMKGDGEMPEHQGSITAKLMHDKGIKVRIPFFTRVADLFRPEEEIKVEWTSPDYSKTNVSLFWGLISWESEKGERKTFVIQGKKGFCSAVMKNLKDNAQVTQMADKMFKAKQLPPLTPPKNGGTT
jgi:hypothetical protein